MRKIVLSATLAFFALSGSSQSKEISTTGWYAISSAAVSVGSSALVCGIILSPVVLPISLIMASLEKNEQNKTATLTTKTPDNKEVKMVVPLKVAEENKLKAGDKLALEKAPEGTGALLKKDGKVLTHMINQEDAALSTSQPVPVK